jgi:16S rRNA processing protein RimM
VSERLIPIGKIVAPHSLDGWVRCHPFNPETTALASAREIYLQRDGQSLPCEIEASKSQKNRLLVKLRGTDRIEDAQRWIGFTLCVREHDLDALAPGQYYHYQAIGLEVYDLSGRRIGTITQIMCISGRDLYLVRGATKEHLIPAVKDIIEKVDFTTGKMIINPPQGLLDL